MPACCEPKGSSAGEGPRARWLPALGRAVGHSVAVLRASAPLVLVVLVVYVLGTSKGFLDGRSDFGRLAALSALLREEPAGVNGWTNLLAASLAFAPQAAGLFVRNVLHSLFVFLWGLVSLGLLALWNTWAEGYYQGEVVGCASAVTGHATGIGPVLTASGVLLPHGPLEDLAFILTWTMSLRAGFMWIRPISGLSRWRSVKVVCSEFWRLLPVVALLLLCAAALEAYANPVFRDRYLLGIGVSPGMLSEQRVGPHFSTAESALSPDGRRMASVDWSYRSVRLREIGPHSPEVVVAEAQGDTVLLGVSWSPGGRTIAVTRGAGRDSDRAQASPLLVDVSTKRKRDVADVPAGRCLYTAWAPQANCLAAVVAGDDRTVDLWVVNLQTAVWRRVTQFPVGTGVTRLSGVSWSPDGSAIAFVRRMAPFNSASDSDRYSRPYALCTISKDGSHLRDLMRLGSSARLAWAPSGRWIAVVDTQAPAGDLADAVQNMADPVLGRICLVRPDGRVRRQDLARADALSSLSWSPDSTRLLYQRLGTPIIGVVATGE